MRSLKRISALTIISLFTCLEYIFSDITKDATVFTILTLMIITLGFIFINTIMRKIDEEQKKQREEVRTQTLQTCIRTLIDSTEGHIYKDLHEQVKKYNRFGEHIGSESRFNSYEWEFRKIAKKNG